MGGALSGSGFTELSKLDAESTYFVFSGNGINMQTLGSEVQRYETDQSSASHHFRVSGWWRDYIEQTTKCESHEDCPLDQGPSSDDDNMTKLTVFAEGEIYSSRRQ
jgi:hypothetical protein